MDSSASERLCQHPVERRRERLFLALPERLRPAGFNAGSAHGVHEVADRKTLANVVLVVLLAARVDDDQALFDEDRGEGYVGRDGDVAFLRMLGNVAIR